MSSVIMRLSQIASRVPALRLRTSASVVDYETDDCSLLHQLMGAPRNRKQYTIARCGSSGINAVAKVCVCVAKEPIGSAAHNESQMTCMVQISNDPVGSFVVCMGRVCEMPAELFNFVQGGLGAGGT